jgi:hypothetical protein
VTTYVRYAARKRDVTLTEMAAGVVAAAVYGASEGAIRSVSQYLGQFGAPTAAHKR